MPAKPRTRKTRAARERTALYKTKSRTGLSPTEQKAVDEFRARLKRILPNGGLKSLILYGSRARGDARRGSDVDLLVVYDAARGEKKDAIREVADDIALGALRQDQTAMLDIEPLVETTAELKQDTALGMPLLQNIAREGIVLEGEPIVPEKMDRKYWTGMHIADAKRQLHSARLLLADGDIRSAISMAYFVYLDAARAALIAKDIAPQSHAGTNRLFGLHFIKTGLLAKKFGPHFGRLETDRLEATYTKKKQFTKEDADRAL
ncbi:MAG: HEPN domain-containing protein, partial [Chloroflexota bacterium]|nr:HEPN domain-containing protein [Chloroflexota bacterium]